MSGTTFWLLSAASRRWIESGPAGTRIESPAWLSVHQLDDALAKPNLARKASVPQNAALRSLQELRPRRRERSRERAAASSDLIKSRSVAIQYCYRSCRLAPSSPPLSSAIFPTLTTNG